MAVAEYTGEKANEEVSGGLVECVAFGTLYMYNPDLYYRIQHDLPINAKGNVWAHYNIVDDDVRKGYSDYPFVLDSDATTIVKEPSGTATPVSLELNGSVKVSA